MSAVPLIIEIDREIESIVPEFLEKRASDCGLVKSLVEKGNFSDIHTIGHRMKGAGGSYGFDGISEIGLTIEEAAVNGDGETIMAAVARLEEYLAAVTVVYVDEA